MLQRAGALIVIAIAALVLAQPVLPIQPSYATSGSMEPVIDEGDLYFVIRTDQIERGDVITFESAQKGGYITHRVIGEVDRGYLTKGDANPSTDQETGHPPVTDSDVMGKVAGVNGNLITVSGAGAAAAGLQRFKLPILGVAIALLLLPEFLPVSGRERPTRDVVRIGTVIRPLFIGAVIVCIALLFVGASSHELVYVATEPGVGGPQVIPVGESVERTVTVGTWVPPFTTPIVSADGVTVLDRRVTDSGVELDLRIPAAETTGAHRAAVQVNPYPATLPRSTLQWLDGMHWTVAVLGSILPIFGPLLVTYLAVIDGGARVRPPTSRWVHRWGE